MSQTATTPLIATPKIGFVSLGCPKALVDSERIITSLRATGYRFGSTYDDADLVIVNTCGFLDSAKAESLDAIGEALDENGKVIVTGCLGVQEETIRTQYPNVLAITGPHQYEQVVQAVRNHLPITHDPHSSLVPESGLRLTPRHYAYLKISEGCNNRCSFCIIPAIRGHLTSRPAANVMMEAEQLKKAGVKELLVISQDTSAYGLDVNYQATTYRGKQIKARFYDLCEALAELGIWVRLHYVYPYPHVDEVMELMAAGKILPYLDIPFQHAAPEILKKMRRPAHQDKTLDRIQKWRQNVPDLAIRSSFIVGFPGESHADFEFLLNWLDEADIEHIGCFQYEPVQGARSNALKDHVPDALKQERFERLMLKAQDISARKLKSRLGQTLDVLIDDVNEPEGTAIGRTKWDAPEIDGLVRLSGLEKAQPGDLIKANIFNADAYDLFGEPV